MFTKLINLRFTVSSVITVKMCFIFKILRSSIRNNLFLIFGLFLGVGLSVFMSQIVNDRKCILVLESAVMHSGAEDLPSVDEYEPRINLAGKPLKAQKTPQEFVRPRYYTTELGIREKLFIAVLTSPNTITTRAVPLNLTLSSNVEKVVYFMEAEANKQRSEFNLNGVVQFSDSRLILKPFHMLKHIADNYLEDYDFFLFTRDTTYLRSQSLYALVQSISVSQNVHMGWKKPEDKSSYCLLDAGILLSNSVIRKMIQNLDWCVKNAFSDSEDSNLGRCIVHSTDVPCAEYVQGLKYKSHQLDINSESLDFAKLEKMNTFTEALSLWPIANSNMLYKLHLYFSKTDLARTKLEIKAARRAVLNTTVVLANNSTYNYSWPIGNQPRSKPNNRFDVPRWDYFTDTQIFLKTDFTNVENLGGADLGDLKSVVNASARYMESKYEGQLRYKRLLNGYRSFDAARGMDYILDIALQDMSTGKEVHRRVQVCKPLGKAELVPVAYVTENTRVNLILIVSEVNKLEALKFMEHYVTECMEKRDKTHLLLVLVYGAKHPGKGTKDDLHAQVKKQAVKHSERFRRDGSKISWLSVKLPDESVTIHRRGAEDVTLGVNPGLLTIALLDLALKKFVPDHLVLLVKTNMKLRQDYLNRVRMNTVKESQIFSPIPFSEFNPKVVYSEELVRPAELDINKNYGHYDENNLDHISFYVKDFRAARKSIEQVLPVVHSDKDLADISKHFIKQMEKLGWRQTGGGHGENLKEFVRTVSTLSLSSVYGLFVHHTSLNLLRAAEPGLRLHHVEPDCFRVTSTDDMFRSMLYQQCIDNRNFNTGTRSQLGRLVLESMTSNIEK